MRCPGYKISKKIQEAISWWCLRRTLESELANHLQVYQGHIFSTPALFEQPLFLLHSRNVGLRLFLSHLTFLSGDLYQRGTYTRGHFI